MSEKRGILPIVTNDIAYKVYHEMEKKGSKDFLYSSLENMNDSIIEEFIWDILEKGNDNPSIYKVITPESFAFRLVTMYNLLKYKSESVGKKFPKATKNILKGIEADMYQQNYNVDDIFNRLEEDNPIIHTYIDYYSKDITNPFLMLSASSYLYKVLESQKEADIMKKNIRL